LAISGNCLERAGEAQAFAQAINLTRIGVENI